MSLPANIRVNLAAPFPLIVKGSGPIAVAKNNGIWTISLNYLAFGKAQSVPDPANTYVANTPMKFNVATFDSFGNPCLSTFDSRADTNGASIVSREIPFSQVLAVEGTYEFDFLLTVAGA